MNKLKPITAACIVLFTIIAAVAQKPDPKSVKKIEEHLAALEKIGYSGSVLVAFDGKPVISRGYGYSDRERKIKNSPRTIFDIGSITKQFTAAAILKLEMAGKLSTEDKITKYFQNVPADKADITIHHLLRHSSGLTSGVGRDYEKISEAEFIDKVFASELQSPVGTRFGYSNMGYSLLALIVERVSRQSYETYLYENLLKPAGMEMTGYSRPKFDKPLIAAGYRDDKRWGTPVEKEWAGDAPYLHLKGNGGILSTTEDLLKWHLALMTDTILSKEAKRKYYYPELRAEENGSKSHYGYGWDVAKTNRNTTRIWHNGSNGIFYADFFRFIDEGVTIIIGTNNWQNGFTETGQVIARLIFDPAFKPEMPIVDTPANRAFTEELIQLTLTKGLAAAVERYKIRNPKSQSPNRLDLLENVVNRRGYDLLREKKIKEAIEIFRLNVAAYPQSSNAYDSLGEALLESGDKKGAIENYKKSLELDPENENAREVLKRIGEN